MSPDEELGTLNWCKKTDVQYRKYLFLQLFAIFPVEAHHWSGCQTINYSIMQAPPVTNCPIQEKTGWGGFLKQHGNPIYQKI